MVLSSQTWEHSGQPPGWGTVQGLSDAERGPRGPNREVGGDESGYSEMCAHIP